jgi:K+-transporting ATPase KdpF subunit
MLATSGVDNLTAMIIAILLVVFLFVALVFPERL